MYKKIKLIFPKDQGKSYYSRKRQNYKNQLSVKINDQLIFKDIDDCEENLPMILEKYFSSQKNQNIIEFDYDITFDFGIKEYVKITFYITDKECRVKIYRPLFVKESIGVEFSAYFIVNGNKIMIGEEYHHGDEKTLEMNFQNLNINQLQAKWGCIKKSTIDDKTYYDDIIMELV
jgi:hypothetical protein